MFSGKDNTDYKKISGNFVSSSSINGQDTLIVSSDALTVLAEHAFRDITPIAAQPFSTIKNNSR